MPRSTYIPGITPRWWDHVLCHPFDHAAVLLTVLCGSIVALGDKMPGIIFGGYSIPPAAFAVIGAAMIGGALVAIAGLYWPDPDLSYGWAVERIGWLLTAGGWAAVLVVLVFSTPIIVFGVALSAAFTTAAVLRFLALVLTERRTREGLDRLRRGGRRE